MRTNRLAAAPATSNSVNDDLALGFNVRGPTAKGWGTSGAVSDT